MKIGIIGIGNIGLSLCKGLCSKFNIISFDKNSLKNDKAKPFSLVQNSDKDVLTRSNIIFVCIRTDQVFEFINKTRPFLRDKTIVFFQAGLTLSMVKNNIPEDLGVSVIRAVSNINVATNDGYTVLLKQIFVTKYKVIHEILSQIGIVKEVSTEKELENFSILPGCAPAIIALFIEYLENIGERAGINKESNREAIFAAVNGTVSHLDKSKITPYDLSRTVASPGGIVEEALNQLIEKKGLEKVVTDFFNTITKSH